jgi:S1-C subfamily serine protease
VSIELHIMSGSRAGQREAFDKSVIMVGRHPLSDLRFDPEGDRDVSSRHAELRVVEGRVTVIDTESTNGTFVNGDRITGERTLAHGDVVSFGEHGPKAEIRLTGTEARASKKMPPPTAVTKSPPSGVGAVAGSTTERIAIAVNQQTRQLKRMLIAALVLLFVGIGGIFWVSRAGEERSREHMAALEQRNDSLEQAFRASVTEMNASMKGAIEDARREADRLRAQLRSSNPGDVEALSRQLSSLEQKRQVMLSAGKDFSFVDSTNRHAVAFIVVEKEGGAIEGGSAFGITRDGLLITNRHVVLNKDGSKAKKIGVIYNDTRDWLPASIVKWSDGSDLALLQVDREGPFPAVSGISRSAKSVRVGSPVAIIGFPLSLDLPMEGEGMNVKAASTLGPGTVSKLLEDVVQIDAFAGSGSSGSPLFDARGNVIGVIWGGNPESGGRIVYAVPSEKLIAFLPASAQGLIR